MVEDPNRPVELSDEERALVVERKAACPFIGSAVAVGQLRVRNSASDPLASIEEVRALGNTGGGNLGDVLVLFARGNHAFMRGDSGRLDRPLPGDLFSLDFPGSQGSHPGHSGILQGDPKALNSGRFSEEAFGRLVARAEDGWITLSEVGHFIAENVERDGDSTVSVQATAEMLAGDLKELAESVVSAILGRLRRDDADAAHRKFQVKFTELAGENNLVGSAGEFGLLFAFLANRPDARKGAVSVDDVRTMFVDKRLPDGWETWEKTREDWVKSTSALAISAGKAYLKLKRAD